MQTSIRLMPRRPGVAKTAGRKLRYDFASVEAKMAACSQDGRMQTSLRLCILNLTKFSFSLCNRARRARPRPQPRPTQLGGGWESGC